MPRFAPAIFRPFVSLTVVGVALAVACGVSSRAYAVPVIGGWNLARGGVSSVAESPAMAGFRAIIQTVSPGAALTSTDTLTPAYLATVDSLFLGAAADTDVVVTPLSPAEQTALFNFVVGGGTVGIVVENAWVGVGIDGGDASFESFLDPFGLDVAGRSNATNATVTNFGHPVTNGPYGAITQFATSFSGWFDNLGPYAQSLAVDDQSGLPVLAVIESGAIVPTSGRVWFIADGHGVVVPSILNATVLLENSVDYLLPIPEPSSLIHAWPLLLLSVGYCVRQRARCSVNSSRLMI